MSAAPQLPPAPAPRLNLWQPEDKPRDNRCDACGRDIHDTTPLTGKEALRHRRYQEKYGFKRGNEIVHFTYHERLFNERLEGVWMEQTYEAATLVKTWRTGRQAALRQCQAIRFQRFVDKMYRRHPDSAWLALCAFEDWKEGKHREAQKSLAMFRHEVAKEAAFERAQREALADWRDGFDQRLAGVI